MSVLRTTRTLPAHDIDIDFSVGVVRMGRLVGIPEGFMYSRP